MVLTLAQRIEAVETRIAAAAERSGRERGDITLIGVTKTVDRRVVDEAYDLGMRHFGENRVQDCVEKFAIPLPSDAMLHEIGQLQSNKAKLAVQLFQVIHSVDRISLVSALNRAAEQAGKRLLVFVQVNVAGEDQKAGCALDDTLSIAKAICVSSSLELRGLMTMAPLVEARRRPTCESTYADGARDVVPTLAPWRSSLTRLVGPFRGSRRCWARPGWSRSVSPGSEVAPQCVADEVGVGASLALCALAQRTAELRIETNRFDCGGRRSHRWTTASTPEDLVDVEACFCLGRRLLEELLGDRFALRVRP